MTDHGQKTDIGKRVGLVFPSVDIIRLIDDTIRTERRSQMTLALIESYRLTRFVDTIKLIPATEAEIECVHSKEYIDALKCANSKSEGEYFDKFGLSYDCPTHDGLFKRVYLIYSYTLSCAKKLLRNEVDIALNWMGGWHHAKKAKASGYCYVNDINGAIKYFLKNNRKVFYVDLDLHHGDGVEEEFKLTQRVLTYSVHHYAHGFYPNTGNFSKNPHIINIPLKERVGDFDWIQLNKFGITDTASKSFRAYKICSLF